MAFQCAEILAALDIPHFDCAVIRATGDLRVLGVERQRRDMTAMPLQNMPGWGIRNIQVFDPHISPPGAARTAIRELLFQPFDLVLKPIDFGLEGDDAAPLQLELFALGVDLLQGEVGLLGEGLGCGGVAVVLQVLDDVFVELGGLGLGQNHMNKRKIL